MSSEERRARILQRLGYEQAAPIKLHRDVVGYAFKDAWGNESQGKAYGGRWVECKYDDCSGWEHANAVIQESP